MLLISIDFHPSRFRPMTDSYRDLCYFFLIVLFHFSIFVRSFFKSSQVITPLWNYRATFSVAIFTLFLRSWLSLPIPDKWNSAWFPGSPANGPRVLLDAFICSPGCARHIRSAIRPKNAIAKMRFDGARIRLPRGFRGGRTPSARLAQPPAARMTPDRFPRPTIFLLSDRSQKNPSFHFLKSLKFPRTGGSRGKWLLFHGSTRFWDTRRPQTTSGVLAIKSTCNSRHCSFLSQFLTFPFPTYKKYFPCQVSQFLCWY